MRKKEFRSDCGKLLFVKTSRGYEIKCPRDKKIYVIPYEQMIEDCAHMWDDRSGICPLNKITHDKEFPEEIVRPTRKKED